MSTATGNPAVFTATNLTEITSLAVPFNYSQDLHGYANPWPGGGGKNKLGVNRVAGTPDPTGLNASPRVMSTDKLYVGLRRDNYYYPGYVTSYSVTDTTVKVTSVNNVNYGIAFPVSCSPSTTYTLSATLTGCNMGVGAYDANWNFVQSVVSMQSASPLTFTTPATAAYITIIFGSSTLGTEGTATNIQLEQGSSATAWEPYENICPISGRTGLTVYVSPTQDPDDATTYAVDWTSEAGTVYGGTLDVVTGVLTVDMANIASYNGETINEPWLSSMDAYAAGTTPTTGAQVVYTLATPLTYQLTPQQVSALVGTNNVWSDTNTVITVVYNTAIFKRQKLIVNSVDLSKYVERDSYETSLAPVYGETVQTLNGVEHTALLRLKGAIKVGLNPQTASDTATICTALLNSPCQVIYHCLQRNADVSAQMKVNSITATFLSRCLMYGADWNDVEDITLTEL